MRSIMIQIKNYRCRRDAEARQMREQGLTAGYRAFVNVQPEGAVR
jgi:hypothetical protein